MALLGIKAHIEETNESKEDSTKWSNEKITKLQEKIAQLTRAVDNNFGLGAIVGLVSGSVIGACFITYTYPVAMKALKGAIKRA